jgi:hypothetical protein
MEIFIGSRAKISKFRDAEAKLRQKSTEKGYGNPKHRTLHSLVFVKIDLFNILRHFKDLSFE